MKNFKIMICALLFMSISGYVYAAGDIHDVARVKVEGKMNQPSFDQMHTAENIDQNVQNSQKPLSLIANNKYYKRLSNGYVTQDGVNEALIQKAYNGYDISKEIDAGATLDIKDNNGNTAVHYAALNNDVQSIKALKQAGVNMNVVNKAGDTALHNAVYYGKPDAAQVLIDAGADVNIVNKFGDTALHNAAFKRNWSLMSMLRTAGADNTKKNNNGLTAADTYNLYN